MMKCLLKILYVRIRDVLELKGSMLEIKTTTQNIYKSISTQKYWLNNTDMNFKIILVFTLNTLIFLTDKSK